MVFVVAAVAFCSCGVDKFIPQGEYLLTKNNVEIDYSDFDKEEAKGVQQAISGVKATSGRRQTTNFWASLWQCASTAFRVLPTATG